MYVSGNLNFFSCYQWHNLRGTVIGGKLGLFPTIHQLLQPSNLSIKQHGLIFRVTPFHDNSNFVGHALCLYTGVWPSFPTLLSYSGQVQWCNYKYTSSFKNCDIRWVLSSDLNLVILWQDLNLVGRWFQSLGAATEKDLSPHVCMLGVLVTSLSVSTFGLVLLRFFSKRWHDKYTNATILGQM